MLPSVTRVALWLVFYNYFCYVATAVCSWLLDFQQLFTATAISQMASLLMPPAGSTASVIHLCGLTELAKPSCKSTLGHLYPFIQCPRIVEEFSFNVNLQIRFQFLSVFASPFAYSYHTQLHN